MFEFKSNNYYYLLYLYFQILKDLDLFDKKLIKTKRKIENLKEKINELFEKNPTLDKNKYNDMFVLKNAKTILKTSLKLIHIYFIIHIYIYIYKCIIDTEEKHNYNILITDVYENLFLLNRDKNSMIFEIIGIYIDQIKDNQTLSKLYLFIFLYQTSNNKHELTKYFNFVFNKMIKDIKGIKNPSVSIKYLFIINNNYDIFLQLFKAICPNPGNMKITYDIKNSISPISKSMNYEEEEKQVIFEFLEKVFPLYNLNKELYENFITDKSKIRTKTITYLSRDLAKLKNYIFFYLDTFLLDYYENSSYLTLNRTQKSLVKQMLIRILFMLNKENYDTTEFRESFNFLLSNKYRINPILYTILNYVYSYYKNSNIKSNISTLLTKALYTIYEKYSEKDLNEKSLFDTTDKSLIDEDREFLEELNRLRQQEIIYKINIKKTINDLSLDNKIILFIQLLKNLYKKGLINNKDLYDFYLTLKINKDQLKKVKDERRKTKKPLSYTVFKTKKLSTAAINRYPAISERLSSIPESASASRN